MRRVRLATPLFLAASAAAFWEPPPAREPIYCNGTWKNDVHARAQRHSDMPDEFETAPLCISLAELTEPECRVPGNEKPDEICQYVPPAYPTPGLAIGTGDFSTCLGVGERFACWGSNEGGKLGEHVTHHYGSHTHPLHHHHKHSTVRSFQSSVVDIGCGELFSCVLTDDGVATCFGGDISADGNFIRHRTSSSRYGARPKLAHIAKPLDYMFRGSKIVKLGVGGLRACFVSEDGAFACAGADPYGHHHDSFGVGSLWKPTMNFRVRDLSVGHDHVCLLSDSGEVVCYGDNDHGQLGLGDTHHRKGPDDKAVALLPPVPLGGRAVKVAAGRFFSCAVVIGEGTGWRDDHDGKPVVRCWGANYWGQLGVGDEHARGDGPHELGAYNLPPVALDVFDSTGKVLVRNVGSPVGVSAGEHHVCAWTDAHMLECWGANAEGQLGQGDTHGRGNSALEMEHLQPVDLGSGTTLVSASAGDDHTCAVTCTHSKGCGPDWPPCLICFGGNDYGQLGYSDSHTRGHSSHSHPADIECVQLQTDLVPLSDEMSDHLDAKSVREWFSLRAATGSRAEAGAPTTSHAFAAGMLLLSAAALALALALGLAARAAASRRPDDEPLQIL